MRHEQLNDAATRSLQALAVDAVRRTAGLMAGSFRPLRGWSEPRVHLLESAELSMALSAFDGDTTVAAVAQAFFGDGISGEGLLFCADASVGELAETIGVDAGDSEALHLERVLEMASILLGGVVQGVLSELEIHVLLKRPVLFARHALLHDLLEGQSFPWKRTLAIEVGLEFEGFDEALDLIILFHQQSLPLLMDKLELWLD